MRCFCGKPLPAVVHNMLWCDDCLSEFLASDATGMEAMKSFIASKKVGRGPEGEFTSGARTGGEPTGRNPSVGRAAQFWSNDTGGPLTRDQFEMFLSDFARQHGFSADGVDAEAEDQHQSGGDDGEHHVLEGEVHG